MKNLGISLILASLLSTNVYADKSVEYEVNRKLDILSDKLITRGATVTGGVGLSVFGILKGGKLLLDAKLIKISDKAMANLEFIFATMSIPLGLTAQLGAGSMMVGGIGKFVASIMREVNEETDNETAALFLKEYSKKAAIIKTSTTSLDSANDRGYIAALNAMTCETCETDQDRANLFSSIYKSSQKIGAQLSEIVEESNKEDYTEKQLTRAILENEELRSQVNTTLKNNNSKENIELLSTLSLEAMIAELFRD